MKTLNIPLDLACRHDVNYTSKIVYGFLRSYYEEFNSFPTIQEIAKSLDRSRQLISKAIANLRDTKIIRTVRTGLANIYIFLTEDVNSSMTSKQNDIIEETNDVNSSDISEIEVKEAELEDYFEFQTELCGVHNSERPNSLGNDYTYNGNPVFNDVIIDVNSNDISEKDEIIEKTEDVNSSMTSRKDEIIEETEDVNSNDISEKHDLLEPFGEIAFMDGYRDLKVSVLNNALFKFGAKYVSWALRYAKHKNNKYRALEKCFKKMHKKYSQTIKN